MTDGNTILSVAKAMELLQLLAESGEPMTLTAISEASAMPKSTVFGLLTTMRNFDVIAQKQDGKYTLGLRLFEYGCQVSRAWDIAEAARPFMEHLAAQVYTLDGKLKYAVGVIGMFRSVKSEEFRQAIEQVVQTGRMISSALGYQKK